MKKYKISLFIFRRDLRLEDNTALNEALINSEVVIPCFIFNPIQIEKNKYKNNNSIQFMLESLDDLQNKLKKIKSNLYMFYGNPSDVVEKLISSEKIEAVFLNKDYTPFSKNRDLEIQKTCKKYKISFYDFHDSLLNVPEKTLKENKKPYTIFTPFYKHASLIEIEKPKELFSNSFYKKEIDFKIMGSHWKFLKSKNKNLIQKGGRENVLLILNNIENFKEYENERDFPCKNGTTYLSSHLKFGTCSAREVYYKIKDFFGGNHSLLRQLYWRDFFTIIANYFPHIFEGAFNRKYDLINWNTSEKQFNLWCEGKTGFPIVDAGMRELNTTGYMHNRVRMVTASFLTKDLHIDWRWGEKYFAENLTDYDPSVNNGNWQWVASTGCDVQPYFRIFNPWIQQKKFDVECTYIKKWIPELNEYPSEIIHNENSKIKNYPKPILNHSIESQIAVKMFKDAESKWLE